mmetsp:Transcript_109527/g.353492  ORF Transcript_109527/g.353492 Transcript_109527/m.353492 type:complete len:222 (+) Transcript_109527:1646-2311(+)
MMPSRPVWRPAWMSSRTSRGRSTCSRRRSPRPASRGTPSQRRLRSRSRARRGAAARQRPARVELGETRASTRPSRTAQQVAAARQRLATVPCSGRPRRPRATRRSTKPSTKPSMVSRPRAVAAARQKLAGARSSRLPPRQRAARRSMRPSMAVQMKVTVLRAPSRRRLLEQWCMWSRMAPRNVARPAARLDCAVPGATARRLLRSRSGSRPTSWHGRWPPN